MELRKESRESFLHNELLYFLLYFFLIKDPGTIQIHERIWPGADAERDVSRQFQAEPSADPLPQRPFPFRASKRVANVCGRTGAQFVLLVQLQRRNKRSHISQRNKTLFKTIFLLITQTSHRLFSLVKNGINY